MSALQFFETQQRFAQAVFSGKYRFLLFGGAIRGGKSYVAIGLVITLAKIFPGSRWAIVRKDLPTLRRNTIPTFNKIAPRPFCGEVNKSEWNVKCSNGSEILFFAESAAHDPEFERWKGLEVNGFLFEEANECTEDSFNKAIERAGTWTASGTTQPLPLILATCNPARNWVKRLFYDPWFKGMLEAPYFYMPSKVTDNPHLTPEYLESLEYLKKNNPAAYNRFVLGDWNTEEDPEQLISFEWFEAAKAVAFVDGKNALGVDVARFGKDDTTLAHTKGNKLFRIEAHHGLGIDQTAALTSIRINEGPIDSEHVKIDTVGLGAGVADILTRDGYTITEVVGGAKPLFREESFYTFFNLRSQIWWELREGLRNGELFIDLPEGKILGRLFEDLTTVRYSISGDKVIKVESKDELKKRIGRSPDYGDAYVYAHANMVADDLEDDLVMF